MVFPISPCSWDLLIPLKVHTALCASSAMIPQKGNETIASPTSETSATDLRFHRCGPSQLAPKKRAKVKSDNGNKVRILLVNHHKRGKGRDSSRKQQNLGTISSVKSNKWVSFARGSHVQSFRSNPFDRTHWTLCQSRGTHSNDSFPVKFPVIQAEKGHLPNTNTPIWLWVKMKPHGDRLF